MDEFDIYFLSAENRMPPPDDPEVQGCRYGEIRIGSFRERFLSAVTFWSEARYEQQWIEAAKRILTDGKTALMSSVTEPASTNFVRWWAMYRDGETIVVQEQLCFLDKLTEQFDPEAVERFVSPRETISEDGEKISEWTTTVSAMRAFLDRRSPTTSGCDVH